MYGYLGENCSNRPGRGSLDSELLKTMPRKEEGAERTDYLLMKSSYEVSEKEDGFFKVESNNEKSLT